MSSSLLLILNWNSLCSPLAYLCHQILTMLFNCARRLPQSISSSVSRSHNLSLRSYASSRNPSNDTSKASPNTSPSTEDRISDVVPTNDPQPPKRPQNVSASNETPVSMMGIKTGTLQETVEEGQEARELQAPDRATIWSRSQQPRERAMRGPRFEQTIMEMQVCSGH